MTGTSTAPPMPASSRLIGRIYVFIMVAMWAAYGFRFKGETRREAARDRVDSALVDRPDVDMLTHLVRMASSAGVLLGFGTFLLGMLASYLTRSDVWIELGFRVMFVWIAFALIAAARLASAGKEVERRQEAGAPSDGWRVRRRSVPGNRDLVYWVLLGGVLVWAVPYLFPA